SPIIDKIKPVLSARIVTLDGVIIGNESIIDQVI
ncbi:MAG: metallophosphoesterase, partial [Nitrosopumilus sp.]|nr:metallophosphoesterase [Nitrosopumilus sp.]